MSIVPRIKLFGDTAMLAEMRNIERREERVTRTTVRDLGHRLERYAKKRSSGPPRVGSQARVDREGRVLSWRKGGPGVISGAHRRSIGILREGRIGAHAWYSEVAPGKVYSRRLELGFRGPDSLGRRYNQPPYRYMRPARNQVAREANRVLKREWRRALG